MIKRALGKGLSALIPDSYAKEASISEKSQVIGHQLANSSVQSGFQMILLDEIKPNLLQSFIRRRV